MRFLSHLGVSRKFTLLAAIAGAAVLLPSGLYLKSATQELSFASGEARATPSVRALYEAVRLTQEHRGLSTGALSGNAKAAEQLPAKEAELAQAFARAHDEIARQYPGGVLLAAWGKVDQQWHDVAGATGLTAPESFQRHTALVASEMAVVSTLVDDSGWALDPESNTYFTIVGTALDGLQFTERAGQLRALGSGVLTRKQMSTDERRRVQALATLTRDSHDRVMAALAKAMDADPEFRAVLDSASVRLHGDVEQAMKMVDAQLLDAPALELDPNAYFATMTGLVKQQFELNRLGTELLDRVLQQREQRVRDSILALGLGSLLLILCASALGVVIARSTVTGLRRAGTTAEAVAQGDLTLDVPTGGGDEIGQLLRSLGAMQSRLADIVGRVRQNADGVATASQQIAQGNMDLSARTESQASAIEQTAASMEELFNTVKLNADHAREADALAQQARGLAERGGGAVSDVVGTMQTISTSSSRISDIIGVIDGVAFQTNILALNAAVEAARAGEQGRGFAIVAGEVRNLAQRTAQAAREIKSLITASAGHVSEGSSQVAHAGGTMRDVVGGIEQVADLMRQISAATAEQTAGLGQVNTAVAEMDQATQHNAALVEESAAAAASLQQQARQLVDTVAVFRLPERA